MSENANDVKVEKLSRLVSEMNRRRTYDLLGEYAPGMSLPPTPKQMEFHHDPHRIRMLAAGNQTGKTFSAAMEVAMHLTGRYPDWWQGFRFDRPTKWWAAGVTADSTRDNPQRLLLGEKRQWGTGTIPQDALVGEPLLARGVPDAVDSFQVQHVSGGVSTLWFKSYERGREKWQGETLHGIWDDEEPPYDIYSEGMTRLNKQKGLLLITFTPLLGMTEVCKLFYEPDADDEGRHERALIQMDLRDAHFYDEEDMSRIEAQYPEHERRARARGLPVLGEGLVYPVADEPLTVQPFDIPDHYRRIIGIDFGIDHPTAACWLAHDPDDDIVYVYSVYEMKDPRLAVHADAIKSRGGDEIPVAWPHDGLKRFYKKDTSSGTPIKEMYRERGLFMLEDSARYDDEKGGPQAINPIIHETLERMESGRLKVFATCDTWFKSKNRYYRKDGDPVAHNDDLMKAMSYGMMMLRHARPRVSETRQATAQMDYDPFGSRALM